MLPFLLLSALLLHSGDNPVHSSDRSRDGLRGPVKSYQQEVVSTYELLSDSSQKELRTVRTSESAAYSLDGRVLERRRSLDTSESVTTYEYEADNRLIAERQTTPGRPAYSQAYTYDDQGRRKKVIEYPAILTTVPPNAAVAATPWEDSSLYYQAFFGGTLTTLYTVDGRAMEGEFRDLNGRVVVRFLREFDAHGNLVSEREEFETSAAPSNISEPRAASDPEMPELNEAQRKALAQFWAQNFMSARGQFKYDKAGRLIEKETKGRASPDETARYEYNQQGDLSLETANQMRSDVRSWEIDEQGNITVTRENPVEPATPLSQAQISYEYTYDTFGNWTRRITRHRPTPNDPWVELQTTTRAISYY